jgi:hypothetical protein
MSTTLLLLLLLLLCLRIHPTIDLESIINAPLRLLLLLLLLHLLLLLLWYLVIPTCP